MIIFVIHAKKYVIPQTFKKIGCLCPKVGFIAGVPLINYKIKALITP